MVTYFWLECPRCHQLTQRASASDEDPKAKDGEILINLYTPSECRHQTTEAEDDELEATALRMFMEERKYLTEDIGRV